MYHQLIEEPELVTTQKSQQKIVPKNIKNGQSIRMQFDDISIDADDEIRLKDGASEIVSRLRPEWGTRNKFQFKIFSDGITNKLVGVFVEGRDFEILNCIYSIVIYSTYLHTMLYSI